MASSRLSMDKAFSLWPSSTGISRKSAFPSFCKATSAMTKRSYVYYVVGLEREADR